MKGKHPLSVILPTAVFFVAFYPKEALAGGSKGCKEGAPQLLLGGGRKSLQTSLEDGEWLSQAGVNSAYLLCITTPNLPGEAGALSSDVQQASVSHPNGTKNNRYYISHAISSSLEHPSPAGLIKTPTVIGKFSFQWESWGGCWGEVIDFSQQIQSFYMPDCPKSLQVGNYFQNFSRALNVLIESNFDFRH